MPSFSLPLTSVSQHLVWGDDAVWAVFGVRGVTYGLMPKKKKLEFHHRLHAVLNSIPDEALLLGLAEVYPWAELEAAVRTAPNAAPGWEQLAAGQLATLSELELMRRRFVLAVKLPDHSERFALSRAYARVSQAFGAPAAASTKEVTLRLQQSRQFTGQTPDGLLTPVTPGFLRWLTVRMATRGLLAEPSYVAQQWESTAARPGSSLSLRDVWDHDLIEGGLLSDEGRSKMGRYVRIEGDDGVSYQSFACVSDMPHEWEFPGGLGEWLYRLDDVGFGADWAVRVKAISNEAAQEGFTKQKRELDGQWSQYVGDPAGAPPDLAVAVEGADEAIATLASSRTEKELRATTIVSAASDDLGELEDMMTRLQADFAANQYSLPRPIGDQAALLRSMIPGSRTPRVVKDYYQFFLGRDLASAVPFSTATVGDPTGYVLGVTSGTSITEPVLFEPARGPATNRSGSVAFVGDLGSGKSYTMKRHMASTAARGGQIIALDRTDMGEYVRFCRYLANDLGLSVQVIDPYAKGSVVQLDPLLVFHPDRRVSVATDLLVLLCGFTGRSIEAGVIGDAVQRVATRGGALADVIDVIEADDGVEIARRLRQFSRGVLGRLAFGTGGTQLDLSADVVVFWAKGLVLPSQVEQTTLADQMTTEQFESQGLMYLLSAASIEVCFADPNRFSAFNGDEVWAFMNNLYGHKLLRSLINDGRKHDAAANLALQDVTKLTETGLADLIRVRLVFRQAKDLGEAALAFLGTDQDEVVDQLCSDGDEGFAAGEFLFRDLDGRLGRVQSLPGESDRFNAAAETNPARVEELSRDPRYADLFVDVNDSMDVGAVAAETAPVRPDANRDDLGDGTAAMEEAGWFDAAQPARRAEADDVALVPSPKPLTADGFATVRTRLLPRSVT